MVCLAEATKVLWVVGARGDDVVYLIARQSADGAIAEAPLAEPVITLADDAAQGLPVLREAALAVRLVPVRLLGARGR